MTDMATATQRIPGTIGDRIAGGLLAILAAAAWWHSQTFVAGFLQPVGPGVFPRLVSVPLGVLAIYLIIRPGFNQRWPRHSALLRQLGLLVLLASYATFLAVWGFLPSTLLTTILLTRLFRANWKQALISGASLTITLYALFELALGIPLPDIPGLEE